MSHNRKQRLLTSNWTAATPSQYLEAAFWDGKKDLSFPNLGGIFKVRWRLFSLAVVSELATTGTQDCSMPGFPALHYLPEFAQTHVFKVGWVSFAVYFHKWTIPQREGNSPWAKSGRKPSTSVWWSKQDRYNFDQCCNMSIATSEIMVEMKAGMGKDFPSSTQACDLSWNSVITILNITFLRLSFIWSQWR